MLTSPPPASSTQGKWHLGWRTVAHTPTHRGFDSFVGYWQADEDYYEHCLPLHRGDNRTSHFCSARNPTPPAKRSLSSDILDFNNATGAFAQPAPAWGRQGLYSSELFQAEATRIITSHGALAAAAQAAQAAVPPLYLYLALQSVHGPVEAPMRFVGLYNDTVADPARRVFSGMLSALDEAVGGVVAALKGAKLWADTLLLFHSDNGGPLDQANNAPLRGGKHTLWEGGVRVRCFLSGPALARARGGKVGGSWGGLAHATDLVPTLLSAATSTATSTASAPGLSLRLAPPLPAGMDGVDLWHALLSNASASPRTEIVHQIVNRWNHAACNDTARQNCGAAFRYGRYKLLVGYPGDSRWQPLPGKDDVSGALPMMRSQALLPPLRADGCNLTSGVGCPCRAAGYCLFDVGGSDPLEQHDLAAAEPALLASMVARFEQRSAIYGTQGVHLCAAQTSADAHALQAVTNRTGAFLPFADEEVPWLNNMSAAPCY